MTSKKWYMLLLPTLFLPCIFVFTTFANTNTHYGFQQSIVDGVLSGIASQITNHSIHAEVSEHGKLVPMNKNQIFHQMQTMVSNGQAQITQTKQAISFSFSLPHIHFSSLNIGG